MRTLLVLAALCAIVFAGAGCAVWYKAPVIPPQGPLFTSIRAPVTTDFHRTRAAKGVGKARTEYLNIWILSVPPIAWGEADVYEAMRNGNLSSVDYVDYEYTNILGIYATFTTIAHGPRRD